MSKKYNKKTPCSNNGKIYVAMPRERVYIPAFVDNRDKLLAEVQKSGRSAGYFQAEGHRVDRNRDAMVKQFLNMDSKPEWLVMIDTDMEHPLDLPMRLTRWEKPIVGGLYFYRGDTHDPFVFQNSDDKEDEYGRMLRQWRPMRETVYKFLKDHDVPIRDGALAINNTKYSPLIECDAVATGALALHRSVLEHMDKPVFEYRELGASEDLMFCLEAKEKYGIPIHCDISTISGHYKWQAMGYTQFMQLYESFGLNSTIYSPDEAAELLAEFLKVPKETAMARIQGGNAHMVGDYWNARFKNRVPTAQEVEEFYHDEYTGQLYLIELLHWNGSPEFNKLRARFMNIRDKKIFELGSGIGTLAIQLALQNNSVTACESNEYLRSFTKFRLDTMLKKFDRTADMKIVTEYDGFEGDNDLVFAIDVFEHLHEDAVRSVLKVLRDMLKPQGRLVYHANFKQQDLYPMHFDYTESWSQWLAEAKLMQIGPLEAVRVE